MRKTLLSTVSIMLAAAMAACSSTSTSSGASGSTGGTSPAPTNTAEIALITDVGTIDDKSFNEGSWKALKKYAEENNITHRYYQPGKDDEALVLNEIDLAVKGGAKIIVCPGFLFSNPMYKAQDKYPDVKFILIDTDPVDPETKEPKIGKNVRSIHFAEEQSGFLAGYAAVKDGMRKLGFMGGIAMPPVQRFGYGFIQGADYAAKELKLNKGDVEIKYYYTGNFDATPENQTKAAGWFGSGTDVIFACGGAVGNSVMKAAETSGKKVIGVDTDQSGQSPTVITSAMKDLTAGVYESIKSFYDGKFEGGVSVTMDIQTNSVRLPMESSKFTTFNQEQYDKIYSDIKAGTVQISKDTTAKPDELKVDIVKVIVE